MKRITRLVDVGISLIEGAIERFTDPERVRYLEYALRQADARVGDLARDNARLDELLAKEERRANRAEYVLREMSTTLGVEGEPDPDLIVAAWTRLGEFEGMKERIAELEAAFLSQPVSSTSPVRKEVPSGPLHQRLRRSPNHEFQCTCSVCMGDQ